MTSFSSIARAFRPRRVLLGGPERGLAGDCRGVAALEFGILLPFMVILLVGIADLGRGIWQHHALAKGVRDAARFLSRVDTSGGPPTVAQLANAKNLILRGSFDTTKPIRFAHWAGSVTTNLDDPTTSPCGMGEVMMGPPVVGLRGASVKSITVIACVTPPASEFPLFSAFGMGNITYATRNKFRNIGE